MTTSLPGLGRRFSPNMWSRRSSNSPRRSSGRCAAEAARPGSLKRRRPTSGMRPAAPPSSTRQSSSARRERVAATMVDLRGGGGGGDGRRSARAPRRGSAPRGGGRPGPLRRWPPAHGERRAGRRGGGPVGAQVRGGTKTPRRGIKGSRAGPRGAEGKGRGRPERCPRRAQVCAAAASCRGDGGRRGTGRRERDLPAVPGAGPGAGFPAAAPPGAGRRRAPLCRRRKRRKKRKKTKRKAVRAPSRAGAAGRSSPPRNSARGKDRYTLSVALSVPSPLSCGAHGVLLRRRRSAAAGPYLSAAGLASAGARAALGLWSPHHLELLRTALLLLLCGRRAENGSSPRCGAPREHAYGGGAGGRRKGSAGEGFSVRKAAVGKSALPFRPSLGARVPARQWVLCVTERHGASRERPSHHPQRTDGYLPGVPQRHGNGSSASLCSAPLKKKKRRKRRNLH